MSTRIAFIGLGNMGGPMAANLVKAGHEVVGYDPVSEAGERAARDGIVIAEDAAGAASEADVVITMLPSGSHLLDVYRGTPRSSGVLDAAPSNSLFIDCSTVAVHDSRAAAGLAFGAGHRALDAPVSGGVGGASAGTLTVMVGASDDDWSAAHDVLTPMAGRVVHCGSNGAGQAAKICNNALLGISMVAVSEAFVLGERLGLTHQALYDVISTASGQCWSVTTYCPVPGPVPTSPANHHFAPGFATALMLKDMGLALSAAEATGTEMRLGQIAESLYRRLDGHDGVAVDFSAVIDEIRAGESPV